MKIQLTHNFENIINVENLLTAWQEFKRGKGKRIDVGEFEMNLMDNILELHRDLFNHTYKHGDYQAFNVCEPKPRSIHKATVRDRILHRAIYRVLYPFFDKIFISDSFSCRNSKGTHRAINRFRRFTYIGTKNNTYTYWILKCDIKKFFASIDHMVLLEIFKNHISDPDIIWLLNQIISSFSSTRKGIGLPLGNLTSQLFANIYMNELDNFIKHKLKIKHYVRYADDFVILHKNRNYLDKVTDPIEKFLNSKLKLFLHPDKIIIKTHFQGIDFLGYVNLPHHRILRTRTKQRMFKKIQNKINDFKNGKVSEDSLNQTIQSYLGVLSHCNAYKLKNKLICGILKTWTINYIYR